MTLYQYSGSQGFQSFSPTTFTNRSFSYNLTSISDNNLLDYGLITNSAGFLDDYGQISQLSSTTLDYGLTTQSVISTVYPFGGMQLSGSAALIVPADIRTYNAVGSYSLTYSPDNSTGTLFSFGQKQERRTYNYDILSVQSIGQDYGSISNLTLFTDEYGSLLDSSSLTEDFGLVSTTDLSSAATPFGTLTVGGSANTEWINKNFYGSIFGPAAEVKVSYSPDNTSGTLFGFGEKVERRSFAYNQSSIENTESDYGLISQITSQTEDYQFIASIHGLIEEFGLITEPTGGLITPFGTITLGGSAITSANYRLFFYGSSLEKFVYSPDNTSGTLFSFGEKIERVTYAYNQQSIFDNIDDYGSVSELTIGGSDYGIITDTSGSQPSENYGLILESIGSAVSTPFGSIVLSGTRNDSFAKGNYSGSGSINLSGTISEKFVSSGLSNVQLFQISGTLLEKGISSYVSFGTLFGFGEKIERRTYAYNESLPVIPAEDFGLVTNSPTITVDCDSITTPVDDGIENYGNLGSVPGAVPFGSIFISGSSLESFDKGGYSGTGTANLSGFSSERFVADTPDNVQLFQISGSSDDKFISDYVGSGTLFGFGEKIESRTYDYNESSISGNEDFGLVSDLDTEFSDYGFITESGGGQIDDDYGLITENPIGSPFGSLIISGTALESDTESYIGLGTVFISGNVSDVQETESYNGSGTITVSGTALESETDSYVGLGTLTISDFGRESDVDVYIASGSLSLSGTALESFSAQTPEDTQLFVISGFILEKETDSYSGSGTITVSGTALESDTESYVGLGTITLSDFGRESDVDVYIASGSLSISGTLIEKETDSYVGSGSIFISGNVSDVQETDSYSGSGTITVSGTALESDTESYVGLGTITLSGNALEGKVGFYRGVGDITISGSKDESRTIFIPTLGIGTGFIGGSISIFTLDVTRYYSPIYPRNALIGDPGSGIGTIRLNDDAGLTITRATLPYRARGTITLSNGLKESFSKSNYNGSGVVTISGIASTKEIQVYAYYGDLKDPGTSGTITLSEQSAPIIERNTESYVGLGTIFLGESLERRRLRAWDGSGVITLSGIGLDSITIPVSDTVLFNFSGSGFESFTPTTEIGSGIITISGSSDTPIRTFAHESSGSITLSGTAQIRPAIKQVGGGTIRLVPRFRVDTDYLSCDTEDNILSITCDREDDGTVKFIANPPEDTILFTIGGSSVTSVTSLDRYVGIGNIFISGGYANLKSTRVDVGTGIITISQSSKDVEIDSYVGLGTIFSLSGSSESRVANPPENTILVQIGGTASTRVEFEYSYVGVGTQYFSGTGSERIIHADRGIGLITLSGNLVYPDIKFVPSPDGSGTISIIGTSKEKLTVVPSVQGGSLFTLYGGFESFSRTNYIGIGTIFIVGAASSIVNNPFQPSRVYVTII